MLGRLEDIKISLIDDNFLTSSHTLTPFNSLLFFEANQDFQLHIRYWHHLPISRRLGFEDEYGKSFMYIRKRRGPRTEPCGTSQVTLR